MANIQWIDTNYELTRHTPVWEHIQAVQSQMSKCLDEHKEQTNDLVLDYEIEVVKFQQTSEQSHPLYWIRASLFLIQNPNHTFTILTLRCNERSDFPLLIDVNYSKEFDPLHIERVDNFRESLEKECRIGFKCVSFAVNHYLLQKKQYSYLNVPDEIKYVDKGRVFAEPRKLKLWTDEENDIFIQLIDEYRNAIAGKEPSSVKSMTKDFAFRMKKESELLQERTERAIYEHLAYFDDLLAGAGELRDYAKKDAKYFGSHVRLNRDAEFNAARIVRIKKR